MANLRLLDSNEAEEYKLYLQSYHPSGQVVFDFAKSNFGTIDGPTAAGKDTLRNKLIELHPDIYRKILSTTTRPLRPGEVDGIQYHFHDIEFIDQGLDERRFLQAELIHNQQISGLDFEDIASLSPSQFGIGILNVEAVKKLRHLNSNLKTIFIVPPSYAELTRRMEQAARSMKDDEVERRLSAARDELKSALNDFAYYVLCNDDLNTACTLAHNFFQTGQRDEAAESLGRQTAQQILNELSGI